MNIGLRNCDFHLAVFFFFFYERKHKKLGPCSSCRPNNSSFNDIWASGPNFIIISFFKKTYVKGGEMISSVFWKAIIKRRNGSKQRWITVQQKKKEKMNYGLHVGCLVQSYTTIQFDIMVFYTHLTKPITWWDLLEEWNINELCVFILWNRWQYWAQVALQNKWGRS